MKHTFSGPNNSLWVSLSAPAAAFEMIWEWEKINSMRKKWGDGKRWQMNNILYFLLLLHFSCFSSFVFLSLSPLITMWTPWGGIKTDNKAGRELWRHVRSCEKKKAKRLPFHYTVLLSSERCTLQISSILFGFYRSFLWLRIKTLSYTHSDMY